MSAYIYGLVNTIIYVVLCSLFSSVLLRENHGQWDIKFQKRIAIWMVSAYVVSAVFDRYVLLKMGLIMLLNVIMIKWIYQAQIKRIIGTVILYQTIGTLMEYMVYSIMRNIVAGLNIADSISGFTGNLIGTFSQVLLLLFVIWIRSRYGQGIDDEMTEQEWIEFIVFPVFSAITILAFITNFEGRLTQGQENTIFFVVFGLVLMNIFVFYLILSIVHKRGEKKQEELLLEHARQTQQLYYQEQKKYEELQRHRHEYRNQMLVIQSLLNNKEYDRIVAYARDYCESEETEEWFDTNHPVVNTVLNLKYKIAKENKILMVVRFNDLSEISMKDADIISILSNLLDNAIEAAGKSQMEKPQIKVKFVIEHGKMILSVLNDWDHQYREENGKFLSLKADAKSHGYGLENVKRIVKKYKGIYMVNKEGRKFQVIVNIPVS